MRDPDMLTLAQLHERGALRRCHCPLCDGSGMLNDLPFERDPVARAIVEAHPEGCSGGAVARVLGVVRERVRQIESQALRRLQAARMLEDGASDEDVEAWLVEALSRAEDVEAEPAGDWLDALAALDRVA